MDSFFTLAVVFFVFFVMYAANQAEAGGTPSRQITRILMQSLVALLFMFAPYTLMLAYLSTQPQAQIPPIAPGAGVLVAAWAVISGIIGYNTMNSQNFQAFLALRLRGYQPESLVHQTAVILCLLVMMSSAFQFITVGGLEGMAEAIEQSGISVNSTLFDAAMWTVSAVLGVGFAIRRTGPQTLERLGLRIPTRDDIRAGLIAGGALVGVQIAFQSVWYALDPQAFADQTVAAQAMSGIITSLPLALMVSLGAAVGEEIIMRGALQPVFGVWLTSIFFVVLHTQYSFTPIMLLILIVGLVLARLRFRYSTSAAIIAHFVYNALPFLFFALMGGTAS